MKTLFAVLVLFFAPLNAYADDAPDYMDLVARLTVLSDKGDTEAQYYLGMMYNNGLGVAQNYQTALALFETSSQSGHPLSAYKIGCYYSGQGNGVLPPDSARALEYKLAAANAGYSFAQYDVSRIYADDGKHVDEIIWLRKAAAQGYPYALLMLSFKYNIGAGLERDPTMAHAYFRMGLKTTGMPVNTQGRELLDMLEAEMSEADMQKSDALVRDYAPERSSLTIKAMRGVDAAFDYAGLRPD